MLSEQLITKYPITSDQITISELAVILRELEKSLQQTTDGAIVELGCYEGTTSLFIQRVLQRVPREFHVYDSFAGLPDKTPADYSPAGEQFKTGELLAHKKAFITHFKKAGLPLPIIHKCWFNELRPDDMPPSIAYAFLDGDYYESIMDSLKLVWPLLVPGAIIVVDDYQNEALPGTRKAVDGWLKSHPAKLHVEASLAVVSKI